MIQIYMALLALGQSHLMVYMVDEHTDDETLKNALHWNGMIKWMIQMFGMPHMVLAHVGHKMADGNAM